MFRMILIRSMPPTIVLVTGGVEIGGMFDFFEEWDALSRERLGIRAWG